MWKTIWNCNFIFDQFAWKIWFYIYSVAQSAIKLFFFQNRGVIEKIINQKYQKLLKMLIDKDMCWDWPLMDHEDEVVP